MSHTGPDRPLTYRSAGVDIKAGERLVAAIGPRARATARPGAGGILGGFGGVFDLKACGYRDPLLVAATDGVGTKLRVAIETGRHETVGIDLVAMCVNDLVVQGAEPLFFLDYYATGRLSVETAAAVIAGIARGCEIAGCALIGGETAEMPGMYGDGDYDLAGFAVGAVERDALLDNSRAQAGDVILGLAASGLHANGLSLARRVIDRSGLAFDSPCPFAPGRDLADAVLEPTRIYARACLAAAATGAVRGFAHITGGGLVENPPRAFPDRLAARIDAGAWRLPPAFRWLRETGGIEAMELARTFNCGIGMMAFVAADAVETVTAGLTAAGESVCRLGRLEPRESGGPSVILDNLESWGE